MFNRSARIIKTTLIAFAMVLVVSQVSATGLKNVQLEVPTGARDTGGIANLVSSSFSVIGASQTDLSPNASAMRSGTSEIRPDADNPRNSPGLSTPAGMSQYGDFVELGESYNRSSDWTEKTHDISAYAGLEVCLAFVYQAADGHTWFIDDILVTSDTGTHLDEDFSEETFPPEGWARYSLGSNPLREWARTSSAYNSEPASAWHNWTLSEYHDDSWLVSPQITLGENPELTYYDRMTFISFYKYSGVWISTGSCDPTAQPVMTLDPDELNASQPTDEVNTQTLTIANEGDATLEWNIHEAAPLAMAGGSEAAPMTFSEAGESAVDLASGLAIPLPAGLSPVMPADGLVVDCDAEPGIIIHDDGTIENGYSGNPSLVNEVIFVELFTPGGYPASFTAVCLAFISQGPTMLDFDIVLFSDDGSEGAPGTELGSLSVSASDIPIWPSEAPVWQAYDISALDVTIDVGSVYIGVRYEPPSPNVFIAGDQSPDTPLAGGYWWNDDDDVWAPIQNNFTNYRALFVRAVADIPPCGFPSEIPWLSIDPESGTLDPGASNDVTVTFDSTGLDAGVYEALICVITNDLANPMVEVPVTMEVFDPVFGVDMTAEEDSQSGEPGESIVYTLTITNTGNVPDSFVFSIVGNNWEVNLPADVMLDAGESVMADVEVTIPEEVEDGDVDIVSVRATSAGDASQFAELELTATAVVTEPDGYFLYVPMVFKE